MVSSARPSRARPHDFSRSARLRGAHTFKLTGQGQYDPILHSAHLGILNSPWTWSASLGFLRSLDEHGGCGGADCD